MVRIAQLTDWEPQRITEVGRFAAARSDDPAEQQRIAKSLFIQAQGRLTQEKIRQLAVDGVIHGGTAIPELLPEPVPGIGGMVEVDVTEGRR